MSCATASARVPSGIAASRVVASRCRPTWLLIEKDDLAKLEPPLPLDEVARDDSRRDGYVLLGRP